MKTKRYLSLNHEMCERAVLEAFDKKWFRRDYLATVEKYGGVSRAQLSSAARVNDWNPRLEAVNGIALEMEQRIEDLLDGETDDLDLDPVSVFYRIDGISMKRRELSNCCPMHQAFGHLAVLGLRPLLQAKLLPYQFASIYCLTVIDSALEACKIESASEERKNLLALGLAARTFNFSANPVTKQLKCGDTLRSAGEYACSEDADIFAMWYVLRTLTDYLRLNFNENLRALTSAMGAMNKIRARYTQIVGRLPKIDAC